MNRKTFVTIICGCLSAAGGMWWLELQFGRNRVKQGEIAFSVSPDGSSLVFSALDGDLYRYGLIDESLTRLTNTPSIELAPAWSPDGDQIAYSQESGSVDSTSRSIWWRSLDGTKVFQVTADPNVCDTLPSYSPDGRELIFARAVRRRKNGFGGQVWDTWDVWMIRPDGTQPRRITSEGFYSLSAPRFCRDGKWLIFDASPMGLDEISVITLVQLLPDGSASRPEPITVAGLGASYVSEPTFAPDCETLAFTGETASRFHYDIFLTKRDGSNPRALGVIAISRYNVSPAFTPDGKRIVFLSAERFATGNRPVMSLWEIECGGSNPRRILDSKVLAGSNQAK
jgi:Tol biopolymer transport system component